MMGVINITPNSFSDGGKFTDLSSIQAQINLFRKYNCKYFDFGAESSAPFNKAISREEELERLRPLFELIREGEFKENETLSFDTYKTETFREAISLIRDLGLRNKVIFNDVSGSLDRELFSLMNEFEFDYVYSHCLVPSRAETLKHMSFLSEKVELCDYFERARKEFSKHGLLERVIFDPCFGFSKTAEQNLELIENIESWIGSGDRWLLGISRKSFLRGLSICDKKDEQFLFSELLHSQILVNWMNKLQESEVLIRLHDPKVFQSALLVK